MDAIVLCGGFATRLEPIGEFVPKALLTLNGRPLVDYIVSGLGKSKLVNRIVISTNTKFADQFEYWINHKKLAGFGKRLQLVVEKSTHDANKLGAVKGTAYAIRKAGVRSDLMVIAGDNFYTFDLELIIKRFNSMNAPAVVAYDIGSLESAKRFGVIKTKGGKVTEFYEKPEKPKSTLVSTGIYFYPASSLRLFDAYIRESGKADEVGNFLHWLITKTELRAIVPARGEWFDIGTLDGYKQIFYKRRGYRG